MKKLLGASAACLAFCLLAGCVSPPRNLEPVLLERNELAVLTHAETARGYAAQGRLDLAEAHLRYALEAAQEEHASLYSDLGFALSGQGRNREALEYYDKALALEPTNYLIQQNAARALYSAGRYVEARRALEEILRQHYDQRIAAKAGDIPRELGLGELIPLYRDLSSVYWMLGYEDEASCYSSFAAFFDPTVKQIGQHSRTLMASELHPLAIQSLGNKVKEDRQHVDPAMLLDYALALAAVGNYATSEQALTKLLSLPQAGSAHRRDAKIFLAVLSEMDERPGTAQRLLQEVIDETPAVCETITSSEAVHWPTRLVLERRRLLKTECEHGIEQSA